MAEEDLDQPGDRWSDEQVTWAHVVEDANETPKSVTVAICGGRGNLPTPQELVRFWSFCRERGATRLIHGGCRGIDRGVASYMKARSKLEVVAYPADWEQYGNAAGPIRNQAMAQASDVLVHWPGDKGTKSMIACMKKLGKQVVAVGNLRGAGA